MDQYPPTPGREPQTAPGFEHWTTTPIDFPGTWPEPNVTNVISIVELFSALTVPWNHDALTNRPFAHGGGLRGH